MSTCRKYASVPISPGTFAITIGAGGDGKHNQDSPNTPLVILEAHLSDPFSGSNYRQIRWWFTVEIQTQAKLVVQVVVVDNQQWILVVAGNTTKSKSWIIRM